MKIIKSRTLGAPTFESVYIRWLEGGRNRIFTKITPNGKMIKMIEDSYYGEFNFPENITDENVMRDVVIEIEEGMSKGDSYNS